MALRKTPAVPGLAHGRGPRARSDARPGRAGGAGGAAGARRPLTPAAARALPVRTGHTTHYTLYTQMYSNSIRTCSRCYH